MNSLKEVGVSCLRAIAPLGDDRQKIQFGANLKLMTDKLNKQK